MKRELNFKRNKVESAAVVKAESSGLWAAKNRRALQHFFSLNPHYMKLSGYGKINCLKIEGY